MALLGAVRGAGGGLLLLRGPALDPAINAPMPAVRLVGVFLVLIGVAEIIAAIGVFQLKRPGWNLGIAATVAFVIDGLVNGYVLYGAPGAGTMLNLLVAVVIIGALLIGRPALASEPERSAPE